VILIEDVVHMSSSAELELKLLKGSVIMVDGIKIKPLTLSYIIDELGFDEYLKILSVLGFDKNKFINEIPEDEYNQVTNFDFYTEYINLMDSFMDFLRVFLDYDDVRYILEKKTISLSRGKELVYINRENADNLISIFRKMYNVQIEKEPEYNPANDRARAIIEKIKRKNEAYAKLHREEDVDFNSIISGVAWKSTNTNIFNISDLTVYQLYDAYYRLEIVDNYNNTMTGLYTGNIDGKTLNTKKISWIKKYISNN